MSRLMEMVDEIPGYINHQIRLAVEATARPIPPFLLFLSFMIYVQDRISPAPGPKMACLLLGMRTTVAGERR
jgi:hypothetical protein